MKLYNEAKTLLHQKYGIDILQDVVLARRDRAMYYVEYKENIIFTKIHGTSPMDVFEVNNQFDFSVVENIFDMDSKYGEVSGPKTYKSKNLNAIKYMREEANITIPILIDEKRYWLRFHLYRIKSDSNGKAILASCYITDVTQYLVHEEALYEKTHKDGLTDLFNRYTLYYHFSLYGHRTPITSFYFDIDDFKKFNDTYGHELGDKVLSHFAGKLKEYFDDDFICYRLGGDEFYCLLYEDNDNKAEKMYNRIQKSINEISKKYLSQILTVSVGIATSKEDITKKHIPFMEYADKLMYQSKSKGKNTASYGEFRVFNRK